MSQTPDQQPRALGEGRPSWAQSPLILLIGLIAVAALVAVLVTSLGGGDDSASGSGTDDAVASASPDGASSDGASPDGASSDRASEVDESSAGAPVVFGGEGIAEVAGVNVAGAYLERVTDDGDDPMIGQAAPVVTAQDLATGEPRELTPGTPRVIGFFAHWCPHCQAELPELVDWLGDVGLPDGVEFVAVSTVADPERDNYPASAWFNAEGWPGTVIVDDADVTLLQAFGFGGFPAFIAIDAEGTVVDRITGNVGTAGFDRLAAALS